MTVSGFDPFSTMDRLLGRSGYGEGGAPGQVAKVVAGVLSGFTRPRYLVGYDAAAISLWSR